MSSQTKNLKSQIVKEKIKRLSILFFSLFLTLAVFSQISYGNTKPKDSKKCNSFIENCELKIENSASPSDWLYYKSSNDLSAYLGKKSSTLPTVRYQKGADYLEFSMTKALEADISSTTSVSLETNVKTPNTPTLFYRNILDGADANYQITNVPFKIKEEIVLKKVLGVSELGSSLNPTPNTYNLKPITFLFSAETTAKPVKQKDGSIAFFDGNNNYLFQLDKPFMVDGRGIISNDVNIEIIPTNKKPIVSNGFFDAFTGASAGIVNRADSLADRNILSSSLANIKKVLEARGIEPPRRGLTIPTLRQAAPRTGLVYHKPKPNPHNLTPKNYTIILSASSEWLNDPNTAYPVIIDPTVTHNADANFTGQMNRTADNDSTSSTQLESSYPEATKDPHTVLLLHFNEANGTTAGIRDYASTTRVITANGNASTTNYVTQLGLGNSGAFDGTGDYLSLANSTDWSLGTAGNGNYTIDFWTRWISLGSVTYAQVENGPQTDGWELRYKNSTNVMQLLAHGAEGAQVAWTPLVNTWYHVALARSGSIVTLYIDGVSRGTFTDIDMTNNGYALTIGAANNGTQPLNGYLDEFRIIKGRALTLEEIKAAASRRPYAVYTSPVVDATASMAWNTVNWTEGGVATGNGEQPYNTNSLVAQWDFNDTSGTTLTASSSGSCTTACNGTLTNFAYTASQDQATTTTGWTANNKKWGAGGLMFDGTNDYVSVPDSDNWNFGSGDFTIEGWIKFPDHAIFGGDIVNQTNGGGGVQNMRFFVESKKIKITLKDSVGGTMIDSYLQSDYMPINTWHHVAFVRSGSNMIGFVDGIRKNTVVLSGNGTIVNSSNSLDIGRSGDSNFSGILDSLRIYKGRALSASEILSNYNAGNIEIQTRTGATSDPNDGSWEAWKPTTGETQLLSMDSDAANWRSDIMASTTLATSTETVIKAEGTGSLKIRTGMASTTANTVALWHFEETGTTTGTYLYDETANNNDATTTGTTVVDGIFGKARKFNGTSDYVGVPDSANWDFGNGAYSIDFWVNFNSLSGDDTFYEQYISATSYLRFSLNTANTLSIYARDGGTAHANTFISWIPATNTWYHLTVTREAATTQAKLFINGIMQNVSHGSIDSSTIPNYVASVTIGARSDITNLLDGTLDSIRIVKGRALSADEIAETYRMGANHHLTRQVSATDLSAQTKLAFWIAADRPGTGLEAMLGESDYANYELASSTLALSTTTVLYIKADEIASSTSIKDSSFSGKAITANGNARTSGMGKIGNSLYFDGTGDYLDIPDSDDWDFTNSDVTIDFWIKYNSLGSDTVHIITQALANGIEDNWALYNDLGKLSIGKLGVNSAQTADTVLFTGIWQHIAVVKNSGTTKIYVDGVEKLSTIIAWANASANSLKIGGTIWNTNNRFVNGWLDEVRIIKGTALSADQIRQAYEYGLRTHPITIDFGATLQTSDLISSATDYNFSLTATTSGLSATTSGLYLGDKIIIKENLGGTEYTAQGTVNAINTATGAITVPSWDTGSTFPASNGYSPNATVFKWQREYFDITGAATTTRDAITNLTLRPTNGAEGRTIYLDDFRYNTNYLTASSSSAITSSNNRYLQYRAIFTSTDTYVSPFLSAFNTLYTALANSFPAIIGISGGGFLSF